MSPHEGAHDQDPPPSLTPCVHRTHVLALFFHQLKASYDAVSSLPEDCIVLFTDGFDVLFLDSVAAVKDNFLAMKVPLLFSGECES